MHVFPRADGGLSVLYRDITERKNFEEALRSSEERFSAAFRGSPYPQIISRVKDGVFLNVNDATLAFYGMSREEMIGRSSFELGILAYPEERKDLVDRLARDGRVDKFVMHVKSRTRGDRLALLSVSMLNAGQDQTMLTIIDDITERKQAEGALRRRRRNASAPFRSLSWMASRSTSPATMSRGEIMDFVFQYENAAAARSNGTNPRGSRGTQASGALPRTARNSASLKHSGRRHNIGHAPSNWKQHYHGESVNR